MKNKKIIIIAVILAIICGICVFMITRKKPNNINFSDMKMPQGNIVQNTNTQSTQTTLAKTCEVESAEIEKIEPHAGYYVEEIYVEENEYIQEGENILKYTNGTYLTAPYDCCITEFNLPDVEGKCLNSHYIQIESTNVLTVSMNIDEDYINQISVGQNVTITVNATEKTYTGYVTHVGSVGTSGKFEAEIEFENDGNVSLGMTANVAITV